MPRLEDDYLKAQVDFMLALRTNLPGYQVAMNLLGKIGEEPLRDFSGMLLNPFVEQFSEAVAPLVEALQPIFESIATFLINILKPLMPILETIMNRAGNFIRAVQDLASAWSSTNTSFFQDGFEKPKFENPLQYMLALAPEVLRRKEILQNILEVLY